MLSMVSSGLNHQEDKYEIHLIPFVSQDEVLETRDRLIAHEDLLIPLSFEKIKP